ncbi:MAG TPA: cytidine deaminase [Ignavibacteriaceae bacterium]|nr:cytidine deaminase [Ignavibacteriaceae bacterium]
MDYLSLAKQAVEAKSKALPTYSKFHVGAALLTADNKIYSGCNIENSSYSLTICAERTAIFKAISEGERKFKAIAIAADAVSFCPPCGACRQIISDLCGDIDVIMIDQDDNLKIMKTSELLPLAFGDKDLV